MVVAGDTPLTPARVPPPPRTFAPLWEVFRISSDKLALCHLELMKKLHDLIKEISRYGEEQGRVHKKVPTPPPSPRPPQLHLPPTPSLSPVPCAQSKEEVSGTLEAVQLLHGVAQLLPKSKESYHSKCQEYERLRKEGTSQKEIDKVTPRVCVCVSPPRRVPRGGPRAHGRRWLPQAELKSRKAGEALRRAVDKYNAARADFEQRMLDSAVVGTAGWGARRGGGHGRVGGSHCWRARCRGGLVLGDVPAWLSTPPWGHEPPFPGDANPRGHATLAASPLLGDANPWGQPSLATLALGDVPLWLSPPVPWGRATLPDHPSLVMLAPRDMPPCLSPFRWAHATWPSPAPW